MAIAKARGIILLTGDKALRNAAIAEGVQVMGTIGILDKLYDENYITKDEYRECLEAFDEKNTNYGMVAKKDFRGSPFSYISIFNYINIINN